MISLIVGYFIVINIVAYVFIYLDIKNILKKFKPEFKNFMYIFLSILGGFIGILTMSHMYDFRRKDKIFKRIIPLIIFIEAAIVLFIIYKQNT